MARAAVFVFGLISGFVVFFAALLAPFFATVYARALTGLEETAAALTALDFVCFEVAVGT